MYFLKHPSYSLQAALERFKKERNASCTPPGSYEDNECIRLDIQAAACVGEFVWLSEMKTTDIRWLSVFLGGKRMTPSISRRGGRRKYGKRGKICRPVFHCGWMKVSIHPSSVSLWRSFGDPDRDTYCTLISKSNLE